VPQVWAWAPWRVRKIRRLVDHILCKLPFEVEWFAQRDCRATYIGHPYFDQLAHQTYDASFLETELGQDRPVLTLLPGSRDQELKIHLPILLDAAQKVAEQVPHVKIAVACYNTHHLQLAREELERHRVNAQLYVDRTPELMKGATCCLACSGSVSLELLHYRKPTAIVYKIQRWAMVAQAFLLRTRYITLTNLIAASDIRRTSWRPYDPESSEGEKAVMPEYLTTGNPAPQLAAQAITWLTDAAERERKIAELDRLAVQYAQPGATQKAADYILEQLADARMARRAA